MGIVVRMVSVGLLVFGCAVAPTPSPTCPSPVVDRGGGWLEVGGPRAWLLYEPPYHARSPHPRRLWVRVGDAFASESLKIAGGLVGGSRVDGFVQGRPDWAPGYGPPPDLGGAVFFAGLTLAEPGRWEIVIGTMDEELGLALIDVQPLPPDSPSPGS